MAVNSVINEKPNNIIDGVIHIIYSCCREDYEGQMLEFVKKISNETLDRRGAVSGGFLHLFYTLLISMFTSPVVE